MIYIENEGALFRSLGFMTENPDEIFDAKTGEWEPYQGETTKPPGWGERLSEAEAQAMMVRMRQAALRCGGATDTDLKSVTANPR